MMLFSIYRISLLLSIVLNIFARCINLYLSSSKRKFNSEVFSYEFIKKSITEMLKNISSDKAIEITNGSFYAFNRIRQSIILKNKEKHSIMEAFICFHETGHCIDSHNKVIKKLYKFIEVISIINMFLLMPTLMVYSVVYLVNWNGKTSNMFVVFVLSIFLSLLKIVSIPFIEGRASKIAKDYMKTKEIIKENTKGSIFISISCILSIIEQISIQAMFLLVIFLFFVGCTFGIQTLFIS